jgi:hypothetical protein
MHLPDPSYVSFGTAVVSFLAAMTGIVRLILEKKRKYLHVPNFKKTLTKHFIKQMPLSAFLICT